MILCDTDILIDVDRDYPPALAWFDHAADDIALPGIVRLELVQDRANKTRLRKLLKLIAPLPTVWPAEHAHGWSVDLMVEFHLSHGLQKYDALVAVTALSAGVPLHTFNVRHYRFIPGLTTVQPYERS